MKKYQRNQRLDTPFITNIQIESYEITKWIE